MAARKYLYYSLLFLLISVSQGCTRPPASPQDNVTLVYNIIKSDYIQPPSDQTLSSNAISGMMEHLDANSRYLDEKSYLSLKQLSQGKYIGIGVEVTNIKSGLKIHGVLSEGPAQKAGVSINDVIIAVDNKPFSPSTSLTDKMQSLKGPVNSSVKIAILRNNIKQPLTFTLQRKTLNTLSVKFKRLEHDIGYVQISFFEKNSAELVKKAVTALQQQHPLSGLILDLRNNPGGLLESAAKVSDLFLDPHYLQNNQLIVSNINRQGKIEFTANKQDHDILQHAPLVILINQASASSSEIVAAALRDHKRAILIGTKSFGKGSVQKLIPLDHDAGAIKITTGYYTTPSGKLIDKIGIMPDLVIADSNAQLFAAEKYIQRIHQKI